MAISAIVNAPRNLPMTTTGEVERLGYSLLRGLDRLGFIHEDRTDDIFTIRFDRVVLYGESWAAFNVDAERLWHFSVADLSKPSVLAQLSAVTKRPVRAVTDAGLTYAIELQPKPKTRLPDNVTLDLGQRPDGDLLIPLGVSRDGAVWRGLADIGHALIVGTTGSGKSNFLHCALASLLTSCGPDVLRLALIDPKRHELTAWAGVPHLIADIANDETQATKLLGDLVIEIDQRGDLLGDALCRDVRAYNRKVADPLPYILCVIDECLDLVLAGGAELAGYLKTIAIRGRSVGVILWAATQHAAAITGMPRVVNVNLSARLVFRVADQSAAQIAGCPGAENLPRDKPGRMLAKFDGKPVELQAFYLPDADLAHVARTVAGGKPTVPTLTDVERDLLTWAATDNGGALSLSDIRARAGIGPRESRRLAGKLEARGWLTKDKSNDNRRVLTEQGRVLGQKADKPTNLTNPTNPTNRPGGVTNQAGR